MSIDYNNMRVQVYYLLGAEILCEACLDKLM